MFTGIIETIGTLHTTRQSGTQRVLTIDIKHLADDAKLGDSIAVNGVCLTVCKLKQTIADFDVSTETINRSTLKHLASGSPVNLERAMRADGRFGGHVVQGHVDGTGRIAAIRKQTDFAVFRFEASAELLSQMVLKGSVAVDGISLTVSAIDKTGFEVSLIPTTLQETTWQQAAVGNAVNIETDILIKVIQKQLAQILPAGSKLTMDKLREYGF